MRKVNEEYPHTNLVVTSLLIPFLLAISWCFYHTCLDMHHCPAPSLGGNIPSLTRHPISTVTRQHIPKTFHQSVEHVHKIVYEMLINYKAMGLEEFGIAVALEMIKDMANVISH